MSTLPGNPFAETHDCKGETAENDGDWAVAQAMLALAFEQRTANLIAWQALGVQVEAQNGNTSEPSPEAEDDIANRLGLGDTNGDV